MGVSLLGVFDFLSAFQTSCHQRCLLMLRGNYGDDYLTHLQLHERKSINVEDGDQLHAGN